MQCAVAVVFRAKSLTVKACLKFAYGTLPPENTTAFLAPPISQLSIGQKEIVDEWETSMLVRLYIHYDDLYDVPVTAISTMHGACLKRQSTTRVTGFLLPD